MQPTLTVTYFSDVLCVWAYAAQIKLDELRRQFDNQIRVEYHFPRLFGNVCYRIIEASIKELLATPEIRLLEMSDERT